MTDESSLLCPVCGTPQDEPPWTDAGGGSQEICPACGIQFGYHDAREDLHDDIYRAWRLLWIANGRRYLCPKPTFAELMAATRMEPEDWDLWHAGEDHKVHLTKISSDAWEVAGWFDDDGVPFGANRGDAETLLAGDRIRLPDGREFNRVLTTADARQEFGLDPL